MKVPYQTQQQQTNTKQEAEPTDKSSEFASSTVTQGQESAIKKFSSQKISQEVIAEDRTAGWGSTTMAGGVDATSKESGFASSKVSGQILVLRDNRRCIRSTSFVPSFAFALPSQ